MVRIGNAYIRCCFRRNIGNHVSKDPPVIRVQAQINLHIRIHFFKFFDGVRINSRLHLVGIILGPEDQFNRLGIIKRFRDLRIPGSRRFPALQPSMASGQQNQ